MRYGFQFLEKPQNKPSDFWLEVGEILQLDDEAAYDDFRAELRETATRRHVRGRHELLDKNLDRLYRAIWRDEAIAYYVETDQDYDRVLDIFVRANQGAYEAQQVRPAALDDDGDDGRTWMPVTRSTTSSTASTADWPLRNDFDKDFVMKSCLVLADLPVAYQRRELQPQEPRRRFATTGADIKSALEQCSRARQRDRHQIATTLDERQRARFRLPTDFMQHPDQAADRHGRIAAARRLRAPISDLAC